MDHANGITPAASGRPGGVKRTKVGSLAGRTSGVLDGRPPLVLLHGLSFDRRMWDPALDALLEMDPARQVLSLDLPGHGDSDSAPDYDIESVVGIVRGAVEEAGLVEPVMVGHSLSAIVATVYATRHPVRGVVNVDQSLQTAGFTALVQSLADRLRGPDFMNVWQMFAAGFHTELLPEAAQQLLLSSSRPTRELVTGYWREVLDASPAGMEARFESVLAVLREKSVPYLVVAGEEPEPSYKGWLTRLLPQARFVVLEGSGHFPQLAHPVEFAGTLAATASAE